MKKIYIVLLVWITALHKAHSALVQKPGLNSALAKPTKTTTPVESGGGFFDGVGNFFSEIGYYFLIVLLIFG